MSAQLDSTPRSSSVAPPVTALSEAVRIGRHPSRRGAYLLETEQWFPKPPPDVFDFFADAGNLETITPPFLQFRIVTPRPIDMRAGRLIDYRLRLHGIPIRWRTEIEVWEPRVRFVDRQLRGPYRLWHHEHTFTPLDGGTLVKDAVTYMVPGGALVHALFVKGDVRRIFEYRREILRSVLGH
jgi:ligand-binding SRPBCC domain-containing protein